MYVFDCIAALQEALQEGLKAPCIDEYQGVGRLCLYDGPSGACFTQGVAYTIGKVGRCRTLHQHSLKGRAETAE